MNESKTTPVSPPQSGSYADKPDAYSLLIDAVRSHISPGDPVRLRVFISGYYTEME